MPAPEDPKAGLPAGFEESGQPGSQVAEDPDGSENLGDTRKFLGSVRREIDRVDEEIVALLNRRARISRRVGKIKAGADGAIFKPLREKALLDRLQGLNKGPMPDEHVKAIYREILSSSRALQRPQTVAYLGPEGTFSYFAGVEYLGRSVNYVAKPGLEKVFSGVMTGEAELGVIPLENSLQGTVGRSLDLLLDYEVHVQAEVFLRISHSLMSKAGSLAEVEEVFSHPQPLEQAGGWLRANLPAARITPVESTAAAARRVMDNPAAAAIGHVRLAEMFGLGVLATRIEDMPGNWTRFFVIGRELCQAGENDKTSLLFTTPNKPGALAHILAIFAGAGVNMNKLESRPLRGEKWRYVFFADVETDLYRPDYRKVLAELRENCRIFRLLGSYPAGPQLDVRNGDGQ
jgi:chorismate mutase/prephenate dehydratase